MRCDEYGPTGESAKSASRAVQQEGFLAPRTGRSDERRWAVAESIVVFASFRTRVRVKEVEFGEYWCKTGQATTAVEFCIGPLNTRPLVVGSALFQYDFVRSCKSEVRRSKA